MNRALNPASNFIRQIIEEDVRANKNDGRVVTRFPPEPNGYLHIGHAKSICLNFGTAEHFGGHCNLRFDDTNPEKESLEYVESIKRDVRWLGYEFDKHLLHASDYFQQLYEYAVQLIERDKAYVCSLSAEQMRAQRGTLTAPGTNSPFRNRSIAENLDLFTRMRQGEFDDGEHVLRAKIDMASPNINMRDPALYRVRHLSHQLTGDSWCIYPMYDFTQCLSDAIEGVTHSLCTLEFEDHRPLYDWVLDNVDAPCHPQQIEFSRLSLDYTIMSKRLLTELVSENYVAGWDDPRMPTISGLRRRGYTPASVRDFCDRIGVTKKDNIIEMGVLENSVRADLELRTPRVMGVLRPLRIVIDNYPDDRVEEFEAANHPQDASMGTRTVPFCRELYIERDDFLEDPPKKFFRMAPGREVRLRYAYFITCTDVIKDNAGNIVTLHCRYDPDSRGGKSPDGRKVKATIHWVSARHAFAAEVRLYDRLFTVPDPLGDKERDFKSFLNGESLKLVASAQLEPSLANAEPASHFQFERLGYFYVDPVDSMPGMPRFNRTVTLRDTWAKQAPRNAASNKG
ncbi:MAG: glutamine--tRNA ligase/YqeY domain fusion protein [Gammaproteobacteria bacterium]|nr:glutamine--tRNA ligase/YqeY domain fusion protein [Gammaproteobacteria bacterium]MDH3468970.1 glutamine--tRNA ligase/YqeY domain fusion protein [Gammaproteobacteria bacterium]